MSWSTEIEAGFGDLLDAVGEPVQWLDGFGVIHVDAAGALPCALFKRPGQLILGDMQITDDYAMEYREADFADLRHGDDVTIAGLRLRVREILQGEDPVLKTARLKRLDGC